MYRVFGFSRTAPATGNFGGTNTAGQITNFENIKDAQASGERLAKQYFATQSASIFILDVDSSSIVCKAEHNPVPSLHWERV